MRVSISTCSFYKYRIRRLLELRDPFGVEIFYEYGSPELWDALLGELSQRTEGPFSIHAPFAFIDIAAPCNEDKLFDVLRRPFDLYHRYHGEFYVIHTYGDAAELQDRNGRYRARGLAAERLFRFNEVCKSEGVLLGAENLCGGTWPLFDQGQFLKLFSDIPDLHAVIDVGHALVAGMDLLTLQKTLRDKICAYHLHNNDGKGDRHERLRSGVCDWKRFAEGVCSYTPNATGVFEYLDVPLLKAYEEDRRYLEELLGSQAERE